jgi:hypothetical protein
MIVYRDQHSCADPRLLLTKLRTRASSLIPQPTHDSAVETLIELGIFESSVADAVFRKADGVHPLVTSLRRATLASAHVVWHTWHSAQDEASTWWNRLAAELANVDSNWLPNEVESTRPEGYAYYAVYPEMYLQAAKKCVTRLGRLKAVCLGLRSIGSSLAAMVAAALEELGCTVDFFTLRPRGHPFSRYPCLQPELASQLAAEREAYFLLVDEGPGISGSSLGGTAAMVRSWGIADDRILIFPSWRTDGSHLHSAIARDHWKQHPQFSVSFEEIWLHSGRFRRSFPGELRDLSAGAWRKHVYRAEAEYPAVQPQHERRKYLLTSSELAEGPQLLSFVGLQAVSPKLNRAERLAEAGFAIRPEKVAHGFVQRRFVAGRPAGRGHAGAQLIETVASYLAHLSREHRAEPTTNCSSLRNMIAVNVAQGLADSRYEKLACLPTEDWTERPVTLDGRMLAHEWIQTQQGYLKVDTMDHHDDHFFPGCQDIAWDLAAAAFELGLSNAVRRHLVGRYRALSGDQTIVTRLRPYAVGYLAFRLGYARLAVTVLGETPDGLRFAAESDRYERLLRRELKAAPPGGWDG